ncbi:pyruvate kinase [Cellulophaga sp. E16_2]|uniref:pyruvate kinase n=1 Tax=unclassified Cellulophaga TaxID=2634405 RepID=UPI0013FDF04A|nr:MULTISPECIES: pyruvate kinase [unclassified Cellulophaga]MBO0592614.1 pyruvate kinase [Cellulophaga sp. E16_2]
MKAKENVLKKLAEIHNRMLKAEDLKKVPINEVKAQFRNSAINLVDYLALRSENIEILQKQLHTMGLSSLASSESHIKTQVINVMERLGYEKTITYEINATTGFKQLHQNITTLLGKAGIGNAPPIMVTFSKDFGEDFQLMCNLLENGMQVARINCAHDDELIWTKMIENLNKAVAKMNLPCKLYMDLAGPKIRTQIISKKNKQAKLKVELGDKITLTDTKQRGVKGKKIIRCTLPGIVEQLKPDQRIYFDDGLFEAVVHSVNDAQATLEIVRISKKKPVIKSQKGINFPDTIFRIQPITDYDEKCLPFIVQHADMIGFSFVNNAADIKELQERLSRLNKPELPIVAKIETNQGVNNLPAIILQGMQHNLIGIMIARGDLAVEIGFERMSEIQDEILWICEAAHTPVIWATQVLESMNKHGLATRSEITDAAHAAEADCVMINKGGHTVEVLKTLQNILSRSRKNNFKNRRLFRKLSIAEQFILKGK